MNALAIILAVLIAAGLALPRLSRRHAARRRSTRAAIRREARLAASRRRRAARVQGATGAADGEAAQ
jgi:hypothetical protein